jgi:hypothetical protein
VSTVNGEPLPQPLQQRLSAAVTSLSASPATLAGVAGVAGVTDATDVTDMTEGPGAEALDGA